jgi:hypothetical protein
MYKFTINYPSSIIACCNTRTFSLLHTNITFLTEKNDWKELYTKYSYDALFNITLKLF